MKNVSTQSWNLMTQVIQDKKSLKTSWRICQNLSVVLVKRLIWYSREENEFVKTRMINGLIRFFWTSGRKCNFPGCDREDLQPPIVNGEYYWLSLATACPALYKLHSSIRNSLQLLIQRKAQTRLIVCKIRHVWDYRYKSPCV